MAAGKHPRTFMSLLKKKEKKSTTVKKKTYFRHPILGYIFYVFNYRANTHFFPLELPDVEQATNKGKILRPYWLVTKSSICIPRQ